MARVRSRTNVGRRRRTQRSGVLPKRRSGGAASRRQAKSRRLAHTPTRRRTHTRTRRRPGRPGGSTALRTELLAAANALASIRLEGRREGAAWRLRHPSGTPEELKAHVRREWSARAKALQPAASVPWLQIWRQAEAFGSGALEGAGLAGGFAPIPLQGTAAAVLCASADSFALREVLGTLAVLPLDETIVVLGDAPESLYKSVREQAKEALIVHYPHVLDADVGRALGAKLAAADIVLFVDAAAPVPADALGRFLWECDGRLDVALADLSSPKRLFHRRPALHWWHEFLNLTLRRPDLKMNTLATLPFALTRAALDAIGFADLAVPVKAHTVALTKRLNVDAVVKLEVAPARAGVEALQQAAGDHIEAWGALMPFRGARLGFPDRYRDRKAVGGVVNRADLDPHSDE